MGREGGRMSRFYAQIQGNRGMASRCGTKGSGMWSHTRGWHIGVEIDCYVDDKDRDNILVYKTGGSSGGKSKELVAHFVEGEWNPNTLSLKH